MMYRPLIVLGISTIFTGFALPCRAQSAPAEGSSVTLSGESLTTIESRTSSEDYQDFFSGTTPIEGNRFATPNSRRISSSASEDFASFLEEEYGVVIGDTIRYPEYMEIFRSSGDANNTQSIRFKIPTDSQRREE